MSLALMTWLLAMLTASTAERPGGIPLQAQSKGATPVANTMRRRRARRRARLSHASSGLRSPSCLDAWRDSSRVHRVGCARARCVRRRPASSADVLPSNECAHPGRHRSAPGPRRDGPSQARRGRRLGRRRMDPPPRPLVLATGTMGEGAARIARTGRGWSCARRTARRSSRRACGSTSEASRWAHRRPWRTRRPRASAS